MPVLRRPGAPRGGLPQPGRPRGAPRPPHSGASTGAVLGAARPGPAPPLFTGPGGAAVSVSSSRRRRRCCRRRRARSRGNGAAPRASERSGSSAEGRGKWIAIPATSSSGCNWSCAPWPCCSPEVRGGETEPREGLAPAPGSPSPRRGGAGRARGGCN